MHSNRAAVYLAQKEWKLAVEDCQAGIRIDHTFARVYKRLFKAQLALGKITEAKEALD